MGDTNETPNPIEKPQNPFEENFVEQEKLNKELKQNPDFSAYFYGLRKTTGEELGKLDKNFNVTHATESTGLGGLAGKEVIS